MYLLISEKHFSIGGGEKMNWPCKCSSIIALVCSSWWVGALSYTTHCFRVINGLKIFLINANMSASMIPVCIVQQIKPYGEQQAAMVGHVTPSISNWTFWYGSPIIPVTTNKS